MTNLKRPLNGFNRYVELNYPDLYQMDSGELYLFEQFLKLVAENVHARREELRLRTLAGSDGEK